MAWADGQPASQTAGNPPCSVCTHAHAFLPACMHAFLRCECVNERPYDRTHNWRLLVCLSVRWRGLLGSRRAGKDARTSHALPPPPPWPSPATSQSIHRPPPTGTPVALLCSSHPLCQWSGLRTATTHPPTKLHAWRLPMHPSIHFSAYPPIRVPSSLPLYTPTYFPTHLSVHPPAHLPAHLPPPTAILGVKGREDCRPMAFYTLHARSTECGAGKPCHALPSVVTASNVAWHGWPSARLERPPSLPSIDSFFFPFSLHTVHPMAHRTDSKSSQPTNQPA